MRKSFLTLALLSILLIVFGQSCKDQEPADPCDGNGVLNVENKLDSAISVKIMETHNTVTIQKDFTLPFTLAGNQPYTLTIDGPQYHKDTTIMILFCDNNLLIVQK